VRLQHAEGYALAGLWDSADVRAVAGFRIHHNLSSGRVLYVDDLVTAEACRSREFGATLLNWLVDRARTLECDSFALDSGVQRFEAHRFYFRHRLHVAAYHFRRSLGGHA
jgi:GNAT superfamily N-acetyltransferase